MRQDETGIHYILPDQNDGPSEEVGVAGGAVGWQASKGTWAEGWQQHGHAGGEPFLGQWFDAESGLHYNYNRYFDPDSGRYLSADPIELDGGLNEHHFTSAPYTSYDRHGLAKTNTACGDGNSPDPEEVPASQLPIVKPGTTAWTRVVAALKNLTRGKLDFRTETASDAKRLLEEARGKMDRRTQYTDESYKKGFEVHNDQNQRELDVGNDRQHLKWKDQKAGGHIYYDTPN